MVLENEPVIFSQWVIAAFWFFVSAAISLSLTALVGGFLVAAFRHGPVAGGDITYRMVKTAASDLLSISPRRILALAWLAAQESLRRRVLIGFAVFVLILLFAGWFLDSKSTAPAALYLSFVLTATATLVLVMALLLSVFSLPADFKTKTIYTIVTKPVRPGEIVLGRILGFSVIGTVMLAVMGVLSYFFVIRVLDHSHEVDVASLKAAPNAVQGEQLGRTTSAQGHRHNVTIHEDGSGETDVVQGHWHMVQSETKDGKTIYTMGSPQDMLSARVPKYGTLRFKDRAGQGSSRGVNVGNEWKYRSFVEGGTLAAAVWTFSDITPEQFPDALPLEMTVRVFRSYKGEIEKGILGSLVVKNPKTGRSSAIQTFTAKDTYIDQRTIPRKLTDPAGKTIDLFDDLVADGELEIWLQCLDGQQYFGVAQADLYLRSRDGSFTMNFVKCYLGIWVQMLVVTAFGVMFSTFLSGPVAMLATLALVVLGFFRDFVFDVAQGTVVGGGPVESLVRLLKQQNVTTQMEPGLTRDVVQSMDSVFLTLMTAVTSMVPDFNKFSNVDYLAHGFDIPPDVVLVQFGTAVGFVAAVFAIGYFFLRTREVAR